MSSLFKVLTFGKSKHKSEYMFTLDMNILTNYLSKTELPEEWGEGIKQPVNEGMIFYVKYLGSTLVDKPSSESVTAEAIKSIISMVSLEKKMFKMVENLRLATSFLLFKNQLEALYKLLILI